MEFKERARAVRNVAALWKLPAFVAPGHFYSPIPSREDYERALAAPTPTSIPGIDLRAEQQLALATQLAPLVKDVTAGPRYRPANGQYPSADAAVYTAMLSHFKPSRVVEIGSGFSSAIALDVADRQNLATQFTFIEPFPERLDAALTDADRARVTIHRKIVQDVDAAAFDALNSGDFLFIDSTHVSKAGSDVNNLFFEVLPLVPSGTVVHVHDIPWPFEYHREWFEQGRAWNEAYLLRAFLAFNNQFEILLFNSWLSQEHPDTFRPFRVGTDGEPAAIWLRRI